MQPNSADAILRIVQAYFEGLHHADVEKLTSIFSPDCILKAPGVRRDLSQWLELVESRPTPAALGHSFAYEILNIETLGEQALVKVYCPLFGREFIDYLGLLQENGKWLIVNKMYADMPSENNE